MPSPVTKVFLSSTARDLRDYREAVHKAIDELSDYKCVRMESFDARPDTPAETCVQEVIKCDLLVGIVGPLYGSNPPDSPMSFTEIEYEAALDNKIAPLMFVTPEEFPLAANLVEPEGRRQRQLAFRERVRTERTVKESFSTPQELARLVVTAIRNWEQKKAEAKEEAQEQEQPPNPASYIPYKCDRQHQEATYLMFLRSGSETRPNFPQFYFVHGAERENHWSFVQRLGRTRIQEYAETRSKPEDAKVGLFEADWPHPDQPEARLTLLKSSVFEQLDSKWPYRDDAEYTPQALRGLLVGSRNSVVLFQHEIQAREWDGATPDLIRSYLEFWDEVKGTSVLPQCFVFINVVYPETPAGPRLWRRLRRWNPLGLKQRVERAVREICASRARAPVRGAVRCPCALLPELECVKKEHLWDWFRENYPRGGEAEWEAKAAEILTDERKRPVACKSMRDVEPHLTRLHQNSISHTPGAK